MTTDADLLERIRRMELEIQDLRREAKKRNTDHDLFIGRMETEDSSEARQWRAQQNAQREQYVLLNYLGRMLTEDSEEARTWRALQEPVKKDRS